MESDMSAWQIFRPHRWARRSGTERSVRFNEVVDAIRSTLRSQRMERVKPKLPAPLPGKAAGGGA